MKERVSAQRRITAAAVSRAVPTKKSVKRGLDDNDASNVDSKIAATGTESIDNVEAGTDRVIYQAIYDGVMHHRLLPGTKLPEPELCDLFGVGRAVVRRVLERLAHEGIVTIRPNKGASISEPTPAETRQIFEARRAIEGVLVELAVARATPKDVTLLRRQLAREHEAVHRFDQPAWARLASDFHLQVAALAGNPILLRYLKELVSRCSLIVGLYEAPGNAPCEHDEHAAIVACLADKDSAGAITLMAAHLTDIEQRIDMRRRQGEKTLAQMLGIV
ncbi:DNA-binding GntR family transcriptional regulator [Robbsia andropogonis]|uniref:GntR family transcriptional regulator n=1 Tax=Robbsia andropogonis TaxID=28092 RepID=UPI0009E40D74|nr:GntR family transcriptional regulator [Robbsia andropogonis]MCP1119547.1 GntR family transcriptional regulator [Robbsia andropogonis]MCP1129530.1 GntR family transcriptional regulator [Robbsia andropogonis]